MNEYVKLSMKELRVNHVSLPGNSSDCWLMLNVVTINTLEDKQLVDDFTEAKRGSICGIMGDEYINNGNGIGDGNSNDNDNCNDNDSVNGKCNGNGNGNSNDNDNDNYKGNDNGKTRAEHDRTSIWYIDANNLYGYAMMQKLPYKDFDYQRTCFADTNTTLDTILNTQSDSDQDYYIVCDINYTNSCKYKTKQLPLMPNKRKINDNELGYIERYKGKARSEKLTLDQNNKTEYMVHYRMIRWV